jgi:hypothetical protein
MPCSDCKGVLTAALLAPLIAGLVYAPSASPQADQLWVKALIQEADLILEESATLQPVHDKVAKEGERMAAQEKALRAEVEAMRSNVKQFNAAMADIDAAMKKHQDDCPPKNEDAALAATCNTKAIELNAQARKLQEQGPPLEARRKELNARVEQHNTAYQEFVKRRQRSDAHDMQNQHDAEGWLKRAREFFASDTFTALPAASGSVTACAPERVTELATMSSIPAVTQARACLQAVRSSLQ